MNDYSKELAIINSLSKDQLAALLHKCFETIKDQKACLNEQQSLIEIQASKIMEQEWN